MQRCKKGWPNGRQVHPHNGPVFSLPLPFSSGRLTTREPWLNKTFAFRCEVLPGRRGGGLGEGSPTGFHVEWKKGLLKFFIDGDTSQINFANGWLSQVSQSSRTDSLRLFGTWNIPSPFTVFQGWHVRSHGFTRQGERIKLGGEMQLFFSILRVCVE